MIYFNGFLIYKACLENELFIRADFRDEQSLIRALKHGRVNAVILEYETAKHRAKIHNLNIEFATPHTTGQLLIRLNKEKKAKLPAINLAIKKIKQSGQLQIILDKYEAEAKVF
ncbi:transporter substrate-binding domain-containing protein [Colwellia sp. BRX10-3]|uniref:transporter substrate-binding domain-containing protein n=1 Tax=Colwellia sp. BRX10-3 TaxID=2759844 RepID=UPI0015F6FF3F|nr:transporter substrate-binding domain-containing protein [Colwellia sp. BRX10-3]MBA6392433.1 transporter substrate-binding domain-containing protein [Colwellia sp. BRX10-3]